MTALTDLGLRNRRSIALASLPDLPIEAFRRTVVGATREGWRVIAYFGLPDTDATRLIAVLAADDRGLLGAVTARVGPSYPALTPECSELHHFECEVAEQCAVVPLGHPALKPVRRHPPDHAVRPPTGSYDREAYPFGAIDSREVHEVAVGPVHAGIIEPGHFRHQAYGEEVLDLEIMLGYQHRGVEPLLEWVGRARAVLVAESIAGDTVIGHAEAHCAALEALARSHKTPRAQALRGIALELERLANHIGDLGALAGDVAYQSGAAYLGRMRGDCLNLTLALTGSRYGRGMIRPGGVQFDLDAGLAAAAIDRLETLRAELNPVAEQMFSATSVQARFEGVGVLTRHQCVELGVVGPPARACEVARDVRHDHPYGVFRFAHIPVATAWAGDVHARAYVRWLETRRSLDFVIDQIRALPKGAIQVPCGPLLPREIAVAMTEGWRGEIVHVVVTDEQGAIRRYKVVDPSFHNWRALAAIMPGNQISDFPLCNKSFNLSYAGHDL
jgi:Ni,Fe-hydrogenase III large subunit